MQCPGFLDFPDHQQHRRRKRRRKSLRHRLHLLARRILLDSLASVSGAFSDQRVLSEDGDSSSGETVMEEQVRTMVASTSERSDDRVVFNLRCR